MTQRVIILTKNVDQGQESYIVLMWAAVPAARQPFYANANFVSQYKDIDPADLAELRAGQAVEKVESFSIAQGTTIAAIRTELEAKWTAYQAIVNAYNPWVRYGTRWNGGAWTNAGVA